MRKVAHGQALLKSLPLAHQEQQGVVFAAYELRVDSLNVMRFNKSVVDGLLGDVPEGQPNIVSAVLFRSARLVSPQSGHPTRNRKVV
jgi:hypothetical protein